MRVVRTEVRVFEYGELSEKAKERAKRDLQECDEFWSGKEAWESLEALAKRFYGKVRDQDIDWTCKYSRSWASFDMADMGLGEFMDLVHGLGGEDKETGKGLGDCVLTGMCWDEDCIDGFRTELKEWMKREPRSLLVEGLSDEERNEVMVEAEDVAKMMRAAFKSMLAAGQADYEYQYSDEAFGETCEANEWEFLEDGEMYVAPKGVEESESADHPVGSVGIA